MHRSLRSSRIIASVRRLLRPIRSSTLIATDTFVVLSIRRKTTNSVLLVRLDAIGDFVLWIDAARALVEHYRRQGHQVVLAGNAAWTSWAAQLDLFDEIIAIDVRQFQRSLAYRYRIGSKVRILGCATALDSTYSRNWLLGDSIVHLSGARERIGSLGDCSNTRPSQKRIADRWYTKLIPADPSPRTELERNAEFIRNFLDPEFRAKLPRLPISPLDTAFREAIGSRPYYVLFPGAGWPGREWPPERFREIANRIYQTTGWHGVICGSAADQALAERIIAGAEIPLLNWAGRTDLAQLAAVLSHARLLICNETSAVHIAACIGVPTVCILGGGHYGRFIPYVIEQPTKQPLPQAVTHSMPCFGCNWQCIYDPNPTSAVPCISNIETETVWKQIEEILLTENSQQYQDRSATRDQTMSSRIL